MEYICKFIWEKNGRAVNEDALALFQVKKEGKQYLLAVICDGIGGLPEGENASSFMADHMGKELFRLLDGAGQVGLRKWRNVFLKRIYQCHSIIRMYGKERNIQLGTTLIMVFLCKNRGWLFQVGDSVAFMGKSRLKKLGMIHRNGQGTLKYALGVGNDPMVECRRIALKRRSVLLLASDGFYRRVEKELTDKNKIKCLKRKGLIEADIDVWLRNTYRLTKQRGEQDNVSAVCVVRT